MKTISKPSKAEKLSKQLQAEYPNLKIGVGMMLSLSDCSTSPEHVWIQHREEWDKARVLPKEERGAALDAVRAKAKALGMELKKRFKRVSVDGSEIYLYPN